MTTSALDIYDSHLTEQLGENGVFTEPAVFDPSGSALDVYGVYDNSPIRENKDGGNVYQKTKKPRFIISDMIDFDQYEDKEITLTYREETKKIQSITQDENGAQVLWLY